MQELPLNLTIMYPGHVPNWDLVSELVNQISRIHRSPVQCKNRFEIAILPREEGKLTSDSISKKQKKLKGMNQLMSHVSRENSKKILVMQERMRHMSTRRENQSTFDLEVLTLCSAFLTVLLSIWLLVKNMGTYTRFTFSLILPWHGAILATWGDIDNSQFLY